jgi:mono/diheme cytochrome c family protein
MKKIVVGIFVFLGFVLVGVGLSSMQPPAARGKIIYEQTCLPCHQADAGGVQGMTPPLRKSPYVQGAPARLIGILLQGLNSGVEIDGDTYTNPMPPFGATLKDEDIADVLSYLRSHFGNKAGPIGKPQVSKLRQALKK